MKSIFSELRVPYVGKKEFGVPEVPDDSVPNIFKVSARGDVDGLEEALKHWDINAQDKNKMTALHHAAAHLQVRTVDRLLKEFGNGLDPLIKDRFGREASWVPIEIWGGGDNATFISLRILRAITPKDELSAEPESGSPEGSPEP